MTLDTHSDHLEIIGDMLPTAAELAELNAFHDMMDRQDLAAQISDNRDLSGASIVDTLPEFGFGFGL